MSDTFLDNQTVTAADLNNIAVDLGYADYSHFPESPPQSAVSALNQITKDLVTCGILQTGNNCAVGIVGGKARIDCGVIVFESGAKKRLDEAVLIDLKSGTDCCIYALNDEANNVIKIVCSEEFPIEGDFVRLAKISSENTITDLRQFAAAKVAFNTPASVQNIGDMYFPTHHDSGFRLIGSASVTSESFTYVLCRQKMRGYSTYNNVYQKFDENGEALFGCAMIKRNAKTLEFYANGAYSEDLKDIMLI